MGGHFHLARQEFACNKTDFASVVLLPTKAGNCRFNNPVVHVTTSNDCLL